MLRIHLLEAQDLVAKDNMMGGMVKGKSDPYVKIHIGDTTFKSHVIKENLNPTWNEMYEVGMLGNVVQENQCVTEMSVMVMIYVYLYSFLKSLTFLSVK